ncbi:hypothetical protein K457DRAFT_143485, partial [Linnemannia elongata AG-77]
MATWTIAHTSKPLLFRVLNEYDDASRGIYPRNPDATLSIDEHIAKGPNSPIGSQYISHCTRSRAGIENDLQTTTCA